MITPERFIVRSTDRDAWLAARDEGVTATMVAQAATPAGFDRVVRSIVNPEPVEVNAAMAWGSMREPFIAEVVRNKFFIDSNDWLIRKGEHADERWMMATPDGLSRDHSVIGEYKTSGKPLDVIPALYVRQIQWQLWVTGAETCVFAYELRLDGPDGYMPGLDVVTQVVERDEKMIADLVEVAKRVQMVRVYESWGHGKGKE